MLCGRRPPHFAVQERAQKEHLSSALRYVREELERLTCELEKKEVWRPRRTVQGHGGRFAVGVLGGLEWLYAAGRGGGG